MISDSARGIALWFIVIGALLYGIDQHDDQGRRPVRLSSAGEVAAVDGELGTRDVDGVVRGEEGDGG